MMTLVRATWYLSCLYFLKSFFPIERLFAANYPKHLELSLHGNNVEWLVIYYEYTWALALDFFLYMKSSMQLRLMSLAGRLQSWHVIQLIMR